MLAQTEQVINEAGKLVAISNQYGFPAVCLMVVFIAIAGGLTVYFFKVVCPERDSRIKVLENLGTSIGSMEKTNAVTGEVLRDMKTMLAEHTTQLGRIADKVDMIRREA